MNEIIILGVQVIPGETYLLTFKYPAQYKNREVTARFMERDRMGRLLWDLRPEFGTTVITQGAIRSIREK